MNPFNTFGPDVFTYQDGCERRIEVFVKIPKKLAGGGSRVGRSGWGVRVDVNREVKFL